MGRRFRLRKRKLKQHFLCHSADNEFDVIALNKYIAGNGLKKLRKLKLFQFPDTGRGVMALENINAKDVLLEIPFSLILSVYSLDLDDNFKNIFCSDIGQLNICLSCQQLIAFYICYIKLLSNDDLWTTYVKTAPPRFSVPYFMQYSYYTDDLQDIVRTQTKEIYNGHKKLLNVINYNKFPLELLSLDLYAWAYFAVNSRCVYLNPNIVKEVTKSIQNHNVSSKPFSFLDIINDEPNLGLIPFLDMFNHSPSARTEVSLEFVPDKKQPVFKLISLSKYKKHQQIFIFYGEHSNLKLFTEYGFCIPSNPYSIVPLKSQEIVSMPCINISREQFQYIKKHNLSTNLFVDVNGLSYNLIRLLFVLTQCDKASWDSKVYSSIFSEKEMLDMYNLIKPLLISKCEDWDKNLSECKGSGSDILITYKVLLQEQIEFFRKILQLCE